MIKALLKAIDFIKSEIPLITAACTIVLLRFSSQYIHTMDMSHLKMIDLFFFVIAFAVIIFAALSVARHAEILAHSFGEPLGTLLLTFSAIIVELVMITTMMFHSDPDSEVARDTIYSSMMIFLTGIIGMSFLVGGLKHGELCFNFRGTKSYQNMIIVLLGIVFFASNYINAVQLPYYRLFLIISSVGLYLFFLRIQTTSHRQYFVYNEDHPEPPKRNIEKLKPLEVVYHVSILLLTIFAISILSNYFALYIDDGIELFQLPNSLSGLIIALAIAAPEGLTAFKAGMMNNMQRSFNVALGSVLSTAALTVSTMLIISILTGRILILAVTPIQGTIIILTLILTHITGSDGKVSPLDGIVNLVLFGFFVLLTIIKF